MSNRYYQEQQYNEDIEKIKKYGDSYLITPAKKIREKIRRQTDEDFIINIRHINNLIDEACLREDTMISMNGLSDRVMMALRAAGYSIRYVQKGYNEYVYEISWEGC